jgi:chaperonin GroEL
MAKKVFYDDDARRRVLGGAQILYDAVKTTMGPKGRNVVISKSYGNPTVTHDGVTVAKGVEIDDVDDETLGYKVGAELIKQAASKMNDVAGDGTTTVTVLTYHLLSEANKLITAGYNPQQLRKDLEIVAKEALAELPAMSEAISGDKKRVAEVATISAGDDQIGNLIADVMDKVGKDGVVTVEEGQGLAMESEVVEGFTMDRGYVSPYMVTDTARMEAVYDKPAILITDQKISSIQDFLPMLEKLAQAGKKDLVLIADDVEGEALGTLVLNRLKGVFNTVAVKAPAFGDRRKDILQDIAILTGGEVISEDTGTTFENADLSVIGSARRVIVTKDETTIIEGSGTATTVKSRIDQINQQADAASSEYDKENLEKRRAALSGKVAVIKVGGATETEIEEKKFRVDDAVAAVKAALDEGIVPGGGMTLINLSIKLASKHLEDKDLNTLRQFQQTKEVITGDPGVDLLIKALHKPMGALLENAGLNASALIATVGTKELESSDSRKKEKSKESWGIDVMSGQVVELLKEGIIDPTRVTREVIQNAVSIAGTAMTMGALVVEVPEKTPAAPMPDMGGMGMGM